MSLKILFLIPVISLVVALPRIGDAQELQRSMQGVRATYADHIAVASQRFGVPASWIRAVMTAESGGDPCALSSAGAIGLMQIMPATWAELTARHDFGTNPFEPRANILAGTAYLRELHDRFGTISAMLAAYNAGSARYEASLNGQPLPDETRAYVAALAPKLGAAPSLPSAPKSIPEARFWRVSALFVSQPESPETASRSAGELPLVGRSTAARSRAASALAPHPGDLFVASAIAGGVR